MKRPDTQLLLPVTAGLTVANLYLSQPLLALIAQDFGEAAGRIGLIPTLTHLGYALGLLLIVPLGDSWERRRLIVVLSASVALALATAAVAPSLLGLGLASVAIGFTTVAPQLVIPLAANLAPPGEQGVAVGRTQSGLLVGVIGARLLAGLLAERLGWRAVYALACVAMLMLAAGVHYALPRSLPAERLPYGSLWRSLLRFARREKQLRQACLFGALAFGSFSAFWATLAFGLAGPPFYLGSAAVGLFGLVGIGGAAAVTLVGRLTNRCDPLLANGLASALIVIAFLTLMLGNATLAGLFIGALLLDIGAQSCHVANQIRIFRIAPEARSRLNTVLMVCTFAGGALGSTRGTAAWSAWQSPGVCGVGMAMGATALTLCLRAGWPGVALPSVGQPASHPSPTGGKHV